MKSIRMFSLIAIGMMVFTVTGATHSNREQKQKPEYVTGFSSQMYDVCVNDYQVASVLMDVTAKPNDNNVVQFKNVIDPVTYLAIITDVGWSTYKQRYIQYKEKLKDSYNRKDKAYSYKSVLRTRDNPFLDNQGFSFKPYS